ncbi:unnamed protein product, partial [Coregonus sp. 'balchen']
SSFVVLGSFVAFFVHLTIVVVTYILTISALQTEATLCLDQLVPLPNWTATLMLGFFPQASLSEKLFFRHCTVQSISNKQKASKVLGVAFFLIVVMWCPFFITNVLSVVCDPVNYDPGVMGELLNVFVWVDTSPQPSTLWYTLCNVLCSLLLLHTL